MKHPIPHLRWWIIALLFCSTVINYVDRQTLSILARTIQDDLAMTEMDYARVVQAFLLAYTLVYLFAGRLTDRLGARWSMVLFLGWWSVANLLTAFARSARSLGIFRFLLGLGEAGNYTAAPKAVSEWFPAKDRALAVGIYTAGATVGATIAPPLIAWLGTVYGWRGAFVITAAMGFLWIGPWMWLYRSPWRHPRITKEESAIVPPRPAASPAGKMSEWQHWMAVLLDRRAWLLTASRMLTDPVWYFYLFWFPKYLTDARGLSLADVGKVAWVVYLAADVGSLAGGWLSGFLIRRGMQPVSSRLRVMSMVVVVVPFGALIAFQPRVEIALLLGAVVAFGHLTWQVTLGALIVDIWPQRTVATVFGLIAAGSGFGGLLSTDLIGRLVT
ncbi:MAG: MFS transporter, partial [bacterium]|nr:MFS transporter [bacterium]